MKFKKSIYISRPVLNGEDIKQWAQRQGFASMTKLDDLHVTVIFCKEQQDWHNIPFEAISILEVEGGDRGMEQFGDATVLTIDSEMLQKRWKTLADSGIPYKFPQYRPHITITYSGESIDLAGIEPYDGPVVLGPEEVMEASDDWEEEHKELKL
jgi:hypothetical protein